MFDLVRKIDGTISRSEFKKAVLFLVGLSAVVGLVAFGLSSINASMGWMTTAVSPILGLVGFFVFFSVLYFWTCIFVKRFRVTRHPMYFIWGWLGLLFLAPVLQLVAYQFVSLEMADGGFLSLAEWIIPILQILFLAMFVLLIIFGLKDEKQAK